MLSLEGMCAYRGSKQEVSNEKQIDMSRVHHDMRLCGIHVGVRVCVTVRCEAWKFPLRGQWRGPRRANLNLR